MPLSLDHVVLGLREARLYSVGPLLWRIVRTPMERLTYNNHTDIQDKLRNARLWCTAHTTVRMCMCDLSGNAVVNPPLRHGREVTRVNGKGGCRRLLASFSLPFFLSFCISFSPFLKHLACRMPLQEMVANVSLRFRLLAYFERILWLLGVVPIVWFVNGEARGWVCIFLSILVSRISRSRSRLTVAAFAPLVSLALHH